MNPNIDPNIGKDTQFRSGNEAAMNGQKGGKASGEARRQRKQFRDELEVFLPMDDKGKDGQPVINPITGEPQTIQQTITVQLLQKARKGDLKAIKLILETLGEYVETVKYEGLPQQNGDLMLAPPKKEDEE